MATVEVFLAIEDQMLINIAKQLKRHNSLFVAEGIQSWQTLQLQELGSITQNNIITIAKRSGLAIDEVTKMLEEVGYSAVSGVDRSLQEAIRQGAVIKPPQPSTGSINKILSAYQRRARNSFNLIGTTMLKQSQQSYIDILNQTTGKVLTGTITPQQALREAASKLADKGIPALVDKAGRQWSTEAYVNMVTRSISNDVSNEMQDARMEEHGVDLFEVSSYPGARPKCFEDQGKIYSLSGNHPDYPSIEETSYGEADGLFGVNCSHIKYPFVEGVSIQRNFPYDAEENKLIYKQSQQQRYLEREIRKSKRELNMMGAIGDKEGIELAKYKVKEKQANLRKFIKDTGRTRRRDREQLAINNPNVGGGKLPTNQNSSNSSKVKPIGNPMDRFTKVSGNGEY